MGSGSGVRALVDTRGRRNDEARTRWACCTSVCRASRPVWTGSRRRPWCRWTAPADALPPSASSPPAAPRWWPCSRWAGATPPCFNTKQRQREDQKCDRRLAPFVPSVFCQDQPLPASGLVGAVDEYLADLHALAALPQRLLHRLARPDDGHPTQPLAEPHPYVHGARRRRHVLRPPSAPSVNSHLLCVRANGLPGHEYTGTRCGEKLAAGAEEWFRCTRAGAPTCEMPPTSHTLSCRYIHLHEKVRVAHLLVER